MSEEKKGRRLTIIIGLIFILIAALLIVVTAKADHYTATITEITDHYTTHKSGKSNKVRHNEKVTVIFVDDEGKKSEAKDVRIQRSSRTQLPKVGETVEVSKSILGVKEYRTMRQYSTAATLIAVGFILIFVSIKVGRKKKDQFPDEVDPGDTLL